MSAKLYEYDAKVRRTKRVRARVKASGKLRLTVFRSARHIYGQIIDDSKGHTLVAANSLDETIGGGCTKAIAESVGKLLAARAVEQGIAEVAFDRGSYMYHGRVKALADGARAGGLKF